MALFHRCRFEPKLAVVSLECNPVRQRKLDQHSRVERSERRPPIPTARLLSWVLLSPRRRCLAQTHYNMCRAHVDSYTDVPSRRELEETLDQLAKVKSALEKEVCGTSPCAYKHSS